MLYVKDNGFIYDGETNKVVGFLSSKNKFKELQQTINKAPIIFDLARSECKERNHKVWCRLVDLLIEVGYSIYEE